MIALCDSDFEYIKKERLHFEATIPVFLTPQKVLEIFVKMFKQSYQLIDKSRREMGKPLVLTDPHFHQEFEQKNREMRLKTYPIFI